MRTALRTLILVGCLLTTLSAGTHTRKVTVTAYCACYKCCGKHSDGITASGKPARQGVTIAASRKIPFGTRVYIPKLGWRVVQDRLAVRYDSRMDVFFESHQAALEFGKQELVVTIQDKG